MAYAAIVWAICGAACALLAHEKNMSVANHFLLGVLLGPLGVAISFISLGRAPVGATPTVVPMVDDGTPVDDAELEWRLRPYPWAPVLKVLWYITALAGAAFVVALVAVR